MRALRHRLGRWLLRDAPKPRLVIKGTDPSADAIIRAIAKNARMRGQHYRAGC